MNTLTREELKSMLDNGNVTLIEVLNEDEYKKSHIKGAINIPLKEIGTRAKEQFTEDEKIVVYCADFECSASPTAAKKLEDMGFSSVYDFTGGKKDWKEAGLPMA